MGRMGYMGTGLGMGNGFGNPQCALTQSEYYLQSGGVFGRDAWIGKLSLSSSFAKKDVLNYATQANQSYRMDQHYSRTHWLRSYVLRIFRHRGR